MKHLRTTSSGGLVVAILGLTLIVSSIPLSATNGYLIHGIGTRAKAMAGAGVALPLDALSAGTNPAAIAWLGKRYDAGLGLFNPNREYTITGNPSGFPGTFGLAPGNVESDATLFFVPNFGGVWKLSGHSAWGLALYGQGGMNTEWPTRTFGGSQPTGVDLSQLFIVPTYATKFGNEHHAIGISPIIAFQTFEATGLQAFAGFSSDPANLTNKGHDTSTGFGAKIGYLGQLTDNFSIGLAYQTEISMEELGDYAGLFAEQGGFDIPSNYVAGIAYKFGTGAVFALDYQEIFYTDVASVSNPFSSLLPPSFGGTGPVPLGAANGAGFGWQDMSVIKAGFEWGGAPWTWRLGFSTGDQPIPPSEVLFNILAPGVMEEHFTIGFTRELGSGNRAFSFSLMHAPSVSVSGANRLEAPGAQTITLEMDQWDLEIGYTWGI
ncbi:MAG: outer membrane protein transport protein [Acidobacteriota bacterium]|nr:outer membrane protein transport protein [Acidobacteriota bacterium]